MSDYSKRNPTNVIRNQVPSDETCGGKPWKPGTLPKGGFIGVIPFNNENNTRQSPTTKPERGNRIIKG